MTTPAFPSTLSASQINVELGRTAGAPFSMNDAAVRNLAGVPSGVISFSHLRGKSAYTPPPAVSATGVDDYRNYDSRFGDGTAQAYPSVNPSGGDGSYSYEWTITGQNTGQPSVLTGGDQRYPTLSRGYGQNENGAFNTTLSCAVSSAGQTVIVTGITAAAEWAGNA